jgi:ribosomal protein S18 acetylase RimI-like enzyme
VEPSIAATRVATAVRRAHASDAAALAQLVNQAYAVEASFIDGQRTTVDEISQLIGCFLVLEYAGGIGAAVLFQGPGERAGLPPEQAYFGMLAVHPALQGMGLGRRMVEVAEALAAAAGATAMRLRMISLREELSRWYKSLGYREVGTAPYTHRTTKRPLHFIDMAKPLAPALRDLGDIAAAAGVA